MNRPPTDPETLWRERRDLALYGLELDAPAPRSGDAPTGWRYVPPVSAAEQRERRLADIRWFLADGRSPEWIRERAARWGQPVDEVDLVITEDIGDGQADATNGAAARAAGEIRGADSAADAQTGAVA